MFKIDDDVPLPRPGWRGGRRCKYPFNELKVGQSFFTPAETKDAKDRNRCCRRLSSCATSFAKSRRKQGLMRFAVRRVEEDGITGVRVWRLS
jgi:hypothetical protein